MNKMIAAPLIGAGRGRASPRPSPIAARGVIVVVLAVCAAFSLGAVVGLQLHFPSSLVYFVWPPSVVVLVALLLSPHRLWWVYVLALFPVHMLTEWWTVAAPPLSLALFYVPVWAQALAGVLIIEWLDAHPFQLNTLRSVIVFLIGTATAAIAEAATLTIILGLTASGTDIAQTFAQTFLADSLAILIFAPVLLIVGTCALHFWRSSGWEIRGAAFPPRIPRALVAAISTCLGPVARARRMEACLLALGVLGIGVAAFGGYLSLPGTLPALLYVVLPLLLWATIRFGLNGTSLSLCGLTLLSILFAIHLRGPFSTHSTIEDLFSLQLFFIAVSVPMLVLAVIIQERQHAQVGLRQSEARYRAVVSNFPYGAVLLYGPDLRHLFADGQDLPRVGLSKASIVGRTLWEVFPPDMAATLEPHYRAALSGATAGFDLIHQGRTYQTQVVPIQYGATPTGMVLLQDVTEQRRAELLAELDRAKTAFFSNVSHEFRTPLTLLLGPAADALADREAPLPDRQRERLELIQRNGERLQKLVNSLLDFSRIEGGTIQANYTLTDLATVTSDLASTFRSAIERAGLQLVVRCEPQIPLAYVDRDMWEKIVLNLLSNALKFTLAGQITVRLCARDDQVELQVEDTGTGISPEDLPHIFERFYRARQTRARTQEGTGIGLTLVQELARLHGGAVRVESTVGSGSTFTVSVPCDTTQVPTEPPEDATRQPLADATTESGAHLFLNEARQWAAVAEQPTDAMPRGDAAPARPADETVLFDVPTGAQGAPGCPHRDAEPELAGARVLVIDDNADMRDYLARLLAAHWQVDVAPTGTSALARGRERPPDLVLADVMMPDLDGFALLRALRRDPMTYACPVILLSARAGEEAIVEGLDAGADDYLVKPFAARELIARVRTHLELAYLRRQALLHVRQVEAIFQAMTESVFVFDAVGGLVQTNAAGHTLLSLLRENEFGTVPPEVGASLGSSSDEFAESPSSSRLLVRQLLRGDVFAEGSAPSLRIEARDGQIRTIQMTGSPVRDEFGQITAAVAVCRDITEFTRARDSLAWQERLYRTLVEHQPDLIARFDRNRHFIYANSRVLALLGWVSGRPLSTINDDLRLPKALAAAWDQNLARVFASGQSLTYETEASLSGSRRTLQVQLAPEMGPDGSVESVLSIATDITDLKQVEADLRHAKEVAESARGEAEAAKRQEEQRRRAAESLREVMAILNSQHSLDEVLDYIVQQAARLLESQAAVIYRVPATPAGVMTLSTSGCLPDHPIASYLPVNSASMRRILKGRRAISFSDTSSLTQTLGTSGIHEKPAPAPFVVPLDPSFGALLAGPIIVDGEPYGGLALLYHEPRSFTADERTLTSMLCDQVAIAIENANLRAQATRASVLAERTRLAREFHDAVTQTLFSAGLVASALPGVWDVDPDAGRQGLENLRLLTHTALAEMRTLLIELRPAALGEKPLGVLLQQLVEAISSRSSATIGIQVGYGAEGLLPENVQIALYRITQEALNNTAKYAHASHVQIQLRMKGDRIVLSIRDDGVGFAVAQSAVATGTTGTTGRADVGTHDDPEDGGPLRMLLTADRAAAPAEMGSGRSGIASMRERARSVGAAFALRSRPGRGTLIVVRWPAISDADENEEADEQTVVTG